MNILAQTAIILMAPLLAVAQGVIAGRDASISGRVVSTAGGEIPTARVMVGTLGYREGRLVFAPAGNVQTDGQGNYAVPNLAPGDYYVRLEPQALRGAGAYYPGTVDIDQAISIPVDAGRQVVGIDFVVPNIPTFKVSGTVLNIPTTAQNPAGNGSVPSLSFTPVGIDPIAAPLMPNLRRGTNGEFEIALPSGLYDIFPVINIRGAQATTNAIAAPQPVGPATYATGRSRVFVADRDVENVTIVVGSADVKGRITVEGGALASLSVQPRITLVPLENTPSPLMSHVRAAQTLDATGNFSFASVPPGKYTLQLIPMPAGLYVADIRMGARSILVDGIIAVGTEPLDPMELTLRRGGGQVQVTAVGTPEQGGSPGVGVARFVLVPAKGRNVLFYKVINAPRGMPSVFNDVAPGDYKVFAFASLPTGGAEQNAAFMAKYDSFGVSVHVDAGQNVPVEVRWIAADKP